MSLTLIRWVFTWIKINSNKLTTMLHFPPISFTHPIIHTSFIDLFFHPSTPSYIHTCLHYTLHQQTHSLSMIIQLFLHRFIFSIYSSSHSQFNAKWTKEWFITTLYSYYKIDRPTMWTNLEVFWKRTRSRKIKHDCHSS